MSMPVITLRNLSDEIQRALRTHAAHHRRSVEAEEVRHTRNASAHRFTRILSERGLIRTIEAAAGRRPALYSFEPLLQIVRD